MSKEVIIIALIVLVLWLVYQQKKKKKQVEDKGTQTPLPSYEYLKEKMDDLKDGLVRAWEFYSEENPIEEDLENGVKFYEKLAHESKERLFEFKREENPERWEELRSQIYWIEQRLAQFVSAREEIKQGFRHRPRKIKKE